MSDDFLLINAVGGYDQAYKIVKNQPKGSTRYNPKCYKMGYLKIQERKLYASDGWSRFVLWDVWGNIADDWEEAISLNSLRKEVIAYATQHSISNGMRLKG